MCNQLLSRNMVAAVAFEPTHNRRFISTFKPREGYDDSFTKKRQPKRAQLDLLKAPQFTQNYQGQPPVICSGRLSRPPQKLNL